MFFSIGFYPGEKPERIAQKGGTPPCRESGTYMNSKIKDELTDRLFKAILQLQNIDECYNFFEDICTIAEIKALAQRLEVARMLREHQTYTEICEKTGASTATISRVNRSLNYGADGYNMVLDKLDRMERDQAGNGC